MFSESDTIFMQCALQHAKSVKGTTLPNPAVGAVVVRNDVVVGEGATDVYGGPHAERNALNVAGRLARGATLYVTLEPCNHSGRTSPCTHAILDSGIKKVVVAAKDPNPLVNGRGIRFLRRNNIQVSIGLMRKEATELNEDFFWSITHKLPWVSVKLACTLDGRIADIRKKSKWITNKKSRILVHNIRKNHAAIAVGRETLQLDNPQLTVRYNKGKSPIRIVFSTSDGINKNHHFIKDARKYKSIIVSNGGRKGDIKTVSDGLERWYTGLKETPGNLKAFLKMAYKNDLTSILVEGGQKIASSLLEHKLVNRLYIFYGNKILGRGIEGISFFKGLSINNSMYLKDIKIHNLDDNVMITGIPQWRK